VWRRVASPRTATPEARRVRSNGERATHEAADTARLKQRFLLRPPIVPLLHIFACADAPKRRS
jgi:hypothetical protein